MSMNKTIASNRTASAKTISMKVPDTMPSSKSAVAALLRQASSECEAGDWAAMIATCKAVVVQAQQAMPQAQQAMPQATEKTPEAAQIPPELATAWLSLSQSLKQLGDIDGAVKVYLEGLQQYPKWYAAYNRLRYNLIRYDVANGAPILNSVVSVCQTILEQHPQLRLAQVTLGYALTKLGKIEEATVCYSALSDRLLSAQLKGRVQPQDSRQNLDTDVWESSVEHSVVGEGAQPSSQRQNPDFVVIGAEKCGTTSLFQYLSHHPAVISPIEKEIDFFDMEYGCGLDWYLSHFPAAAPQPAGFKWITGETSANYLYSDVAPARVSKHFPRTKLVVILRHPVDRTISRYSMMVRNGAETRSFEAAVREEIQLIERAIDSDSSLWPVLNRCRHVGNSLYYYHLRRWLSHFSLDQLLVLQSESLFLHPEQTLQQLYSDLGLRNLTDDSAAQTYPQYNSGTYSTVISDELKQHLFDFYQPHIRKLESLLGRSFGWRRS